MKNFAILIVSAIVFISCSKEADLYNSDLNQQNKAQLSVSNAFKVGELDGSGIATITYSLNELAELTSCAVSEELTIGLNITDEGVGYYLGGLGTSIGSTTTFKVELTTDGDDLYWEDGAHVAMCQTTNAVPCEVSIIAQETFICVNNNPLVCNDDEIGGDSTGEYPSCGDTDWPWATTDKDKK